jgi:flagellar FliL protein
MSDTPQPAAAEKPAKKGGRGKLLIIAALAIVLLGGGFGAYWTLWRAAPAGEAVKKDAKPANNGIVSFEPFVVNLADTGGQRFLRVSVRLLLDEQEEAERLQKSDVALMRLRSEILELLTEQTADQVVTQEGKTRLKKSIVEHTSAIAQPVKISDVLFSDFVVQF